MPLIKINARGKPSGHEFCTAQIGEFHPAVSASSYCSTLSIWAPGSEHPPQVVTLLLPWAEGTKS